VARLILLAAVIAVIYILLRRVQSMPPHQRRGEYIKLGLGVAVVGTIILAATGRMNWIGAAATALLVGARQILPLLIRFFPALTSLLGKRAAAGGQSSTVETVLLRMQLDHDNGALQGQILKGSFQGWRLTDMNREQLETFYQFCCREDADSVQLLQSYLQQRFPGEAPFDEHQQAGPTSVNSMGRPEALAVLGLNEDAEEEDIVAAHRKLMQKLHPDRGGNDYLAAQINHARDVLLG
jgi:hypothetical protein